MTDLLTVVTFWLVLATIATFFSVWLRVTTAICEILIGIITAYPSVPGHVRQILGIIKYMRAVRKPTSCQYQAQVSQA
jgi:hypothetical protein